MATNYYQTGMISEDGSDKLYKTWNTLQRPTES